VASLFHHDFGARLWDESIPLLNEALPQSNIAGDIVTLVPK